MRSSTISEERYHHGDLPNALLAAVDAIVRERGVAALTLRAIARRTGVSHAAPAHHFGDKAGVLTAFAAEGFAMLRDRVAAAREASPGSERPALLRVGLAYIDFAVSEPGRFAVMFRPDLLRTDDPHYVTSREAAFEALFDAVADLRSDVGPSSAEILYAATGAWSIVHGFATLWLAGDLPDDVTAGSVIEAAEASLAQFGAALIVSVEEPFRSER